MRATDDGFEAGDGGVAIAAFEPAHVDAHRRLVTDTLREFGFEPDAAIDPDLDDPLEAFDALWVAIADGEVVGSVAVRDLGYGELELKRMYLRPQARGRGLGKRLLGTALDYARESGAHVVKLDTSERMETARHLYEAHGFVRVPGYAPRQGQQRLLYELRF